MSEATVSSINDRAAEEFYRRGLDAERRGCTKKPWSSTSVRLNENPDHEQAAFHLAVLYDRRAEDAKAIELLRAHLHQPPGALNALMNLRFFTKTTTITMKRTAASMRSCGPNANHERAGCTWKTWESGRSMHYDEDLERRGDRRNAVLNIFRDPILSFPVRASRIASKK